MEKYIKIKIPFGSKSYIKKINRKMVMKANAYYVFDLEKQKVIDEYIEIIRSNFRLTDKDMIKPTAYYKQKDVKNFRDIFLDKYSKTDPCAITTRRYQELTNNQINEINNYLKQNYTTVRKMFSYLSGSNITGAETNNYASPIRCIDNEYFDCNFANVFKNYYSDEEDRTKNYPDNIPVYSLSMLINSKIIKDFENTFYKYNDEFLYQNNELGEYYNYEHEDKFVDICNEIKFKLKENQELFIEAIINKTIDDYDAYISDKEKLRKKLHTFHGSNVKLYIKKGAIPLHSTTEKYNLKTVQNAHIFPVSKAVNNINYENLVEAINPYNCLRIDSNTHILFDNNKIFFNEKGDVILKNNEVLKNNYLDLKNMPKETKNFFNTYLSHLDKD